MKYKFILLLLSLFVVSSKCLSYDFKVDDIYYNVLSLEDLTVETTGMLCNYKGDVVIPETVEYKGHIMKVISIGQSTFNQCTELTSVHIPSSIISIKDAFEGCGLKEIIMPNSVTEISPYLFMNSTKLEYIKWSENIKEIPMWACYGCTSLKNIIIPSNILSVDHHAFQKTGVQSIEIEDGNVPLKIHTEVFNQVLDNISLYMGRNVESLNSESNRILFWGVKDLSVGQNVTNIKDIIEGRVSNITLYCSNPPAANSYSNNAYMNNKVLVPKGSLSLYKATEPWKYFWDISEMDDDIVTQCSTPIILYNKGHLSFECSTQDVKYVSSIECDDIKSYNSESIELSATYTITVYATKEGYLQSEPASATLCWIEFEPKSEGITGIERRETSPLLISSSNGELRITGPENCSIQFYSISGTLIGTERIANGSLTFSTNEKIVIVKVNGKSIKVSN